MPALPFFSFVISWYAMLGMAAGTIIYHAFSFSNWFVAILLHDGRPIWHVLASDSTMILLLVMTSALSVVSVGTIKRNGGFSRQYLVVTLVVGAACFAMLGYWPVFG